MTRKKIEPIQSPKGMHDMLPADYYYMESVYGAFEEIAQFYGCQPIAIPHVERAELFERTLGATSDIVEKQMYNLKATGKERLTLRPEGTAGIARAYIENGMVSLPHPVKLFYRGSFFRHESPQKGRFREFRGAGVEVIGEADGIMDGLIIRMLHALCVQLGLTDAIVAINSIGDAECRPKFRTALVEYYKKHKKDLCKDCIRRMKDNPLRALDCKVPGCVTLAQQAPNILDFLCRECKQHFRNVLEYLDIASIPYTLVPTLVRGLDYYTRTVFELTIEDASAADSNGEEANVSLRLALGGGGRYDRLIELLGGTPTPGIGAAVGVERFVAAMKRRKIKPAKQYSPSLFLVQLGPEARKAAFISLEKFRAAGIIVAEALSKDSLKTQLRIASNMNVPFSLIIGHKEAIDGTIILKDMSSGLQETYSQEKIIDIVKKKMKI